MTKNVKIEDIVKHYKKKAREARKEHVTDGLEAINRERGELAKQLELLETKITERGLRMTDYVQNGSKSDVTPEDYGLYGNEILAFRADIKAIDNRKAVLDNNWRKRQILWNGKTQAITQGFDADMKALFSDKSQETLASVRSILQGTA